MPSLHLGEVPLPDGRKAKATVRVHVTPQSWDEPGYVEVVEDDPLEIEEIDGKEPTEEDYLLEFKVKDYTLTLEEFCIDWLLEHGTYEESYDD